MYPEHRYLLETRFNPSRIRIYGDTAEPWHGADLPLLDASMMPSILTLIAPMLAVATACLALAILG